jgi:4-hydroxybenzoate polyprenyltransferase
MVGALLGVGILLTMGTIYYLGLLATAGLLIYEHSLVSPHDMSKIQRAFFTVNSYVASVLFLFTLVDLIV